MVNRNEQHSIALLKPIQISPRSFKRQLETIFSVLAQLHLRTTVLAKLPQGNSWYADLKAYSQAIHPLPDIYLFNRQPTTPSDWCTTIPIPLAHPMRGEYFLLVVSERVGLWINGSREEVSTPAEAVDPDADDTAADEAETFPKVNCSITLQTPLIQQKLESLRDIIQTSLVEHASQPRLRSLLTNWDDRLGLPTSCYPGLIDAILLHESEYHEQLQRKARSFRRQAMAASSLSTQNEALLNSLRLKDDFLNTVGQELRTPLSTIKTALPLLSSSTLKPPQRQRYLDMISRECDRQVNLINGVLELLQIERSLATIAPEPVKLFDVLPGVVSTYQPIAQEKGIRLAYTVPNTLPPVCCPENWVRQIVIHLLNNSIRYTDAGGEVWVTAQEDDDENVSVNVKDTGSGIPPHELPRIFDHFYRGRQTSSEDEGVGLGLSIVQQLILYCGGQISVESQPEVGTHFKVKLPLYRAS